MFFYENCVAAIDTVNCVDAIDNVNCVAAIDKVNCVAGIDKVHLECPRLSTIECFTIFEAQRLNECVSYRSQESQESARSARSARYTDITRNIAIFCSLCTYAYIFRL